MKNQELGIQLYVCSISCFVCQFFAASTWEVRSINTPMGSNTAKSLVTQVLETQADGWSRWKNSSCSKFEKTVPYALLSQVSGLKEYVEANPLLKSESSTNTASSVSSLNGDFSDVSNDQFYDALDGDSSSSSDEEFNDEEQHDEVGISIFLNHILDPKVVLF